MAESSLTETLSIVALIEVTKAYHFTALKHVNQRRKGAAAEPYVNHLTEVVELVAVATRGNDIDLVMAAVLHDTIEDTATSMEELAAAFGLRVAELVAEVTDDKSLPKPERKRLQMSRREPLVGERVRQSLKTGRQWGAFLSNRS